MLHLDVKIYIWFIDKVKLEEEIGWVALLIKIWQNDVGNVRGRNYKGYNDSLEFWCL